MSATISRSLSLGAVLLVLLLTTACVAINTGGSWGKTVTTIEDTLNRAVASHESGDLERANGLAKDAYFEVFESSGMETAIRLSISSRRAFEIENGFTEVRQAIRSGDSGAQVQERVAVLMAMLRQDAAALQGSGGTSAIEGFMSSFLIIVREGFEAILVIGAIIAYLVKSGNGAKVRTIYGSALLALLASVATAVAVKYLFNISGASQEFLEGATMLLAVAVLFSVSFWLLSKVQAQKWQQYIQGKIGRSLTTGNTLALGSAAFLAVYREGAETVLFYQALLSGSEGGNIGPIALGFGAGALVLAAVFVAVRWGSLKVPIKPFFIATGVFLYYMAFVFAGKGIRELQEAGTVGTSIVPGFPAVDLLGIYPTWEGLALQTALILVAVVGLAYQFLGRSRATSTNRSATA